MSQSRNSVRLEMVSDFDVALQHKDFLGMINESRKGIRLVRAVDDTSFQLSKKELAKLFS